MSQDPMFYVTTNADGSECHGDGAWSLPVLNADGSWTPGEWRAVGGRLVPWLNGLAISSAEHLLEWLGPAIWEAEIYGRVVRRRGIIVVRQARLVRGFPAWNERTARLFAVDCASEVLHLAAHEVTPLLEWVLSVARRYAEGTAGLHELEVANTAAWGMTAGVWDSAESASAREAATAAWSTTIDEAWKAASGAANCAGRALASDAEPDTGAFMETSPEAHRTWLTAWEAACQAASVGQTERLMRVLGEREPEYGGPALLTAHRHTDPRRPAAATLVMGCVAQKPPSAIGKLIASNGAVRNAGHSSQKDLPSGAVRTRGLRRTDHATARGCPFGTGLTTVARVAGPGRPTVAVDRVG